LKPETSFLHCKHYIICSK